MKITKWSPSLDISAESPIIPIWISFPKLHPHFFAPRILFGLGELFGKPLKIDEATSVGSRPSNARVLVELDVTKTYPKHVWLGSESLGYVQEVILDEFPQFCGVCKSLGHTTGKCNSVNLAGVPIAAGNVENVSHLGVVNGDKSIMDNGVIGLAEVSEAVVEVVPPVVHAGCSSIVEIPPDTLVEAVGVINGKGAIVVTDEFVFSPYALPFVPEVLDGNVRQEILVDSSVLLVPEVGHGAVNVENSVVLPVQDAVKPNDNVMLLEKEGGDADGFVYVTVEQGGSDAGGVKSLNCFVEIPVKQVDSKEMDDCVSKDSGKEIRDQKNWLSDSSEEEDYSESFVSDMDFSLDRSSKAFRGKFWGRGRRKR